MRTGAIAGLVLLSVTAGIGVGEAIYRSRICRDVIGGVCGIYENDAKRETLADQYLTGGKVQAASSHSIAKRLAANEKLRQLSIHESASVSEESERLRHQFGDDSAWQKRLDGAHISESRLRVSLRENLCGRQWIERSLADQPAIDEQTLHDYYAQHLQAFVQPARFRASHIFLAAPPGTLPEIVEAKRKLIDAIADRLRGGGEEFDALVWEASEDEATKSRGGDLGYFCDSRIPQDFFNTVSHLKVGEVPKMFRSALGFHIVQLTETKPARQMSFEEARSEILTRLTNAHRREAVENLASRLSESSTLRAGWFWN
jgi:peptidyl-prolyl cis-trans isomerase C